MVTSLAQKKKCLIRETGVLLCLKNKKEAVLPILFYIMLLFPEPSVFSDMYVNPYVICFNDDVINYISLPSYFSSILPSFFRCLDIQH